MMAQNDGAAPFPSRATRYRLPRRNREHSARNRCGPRAPCPSRWKKNRCLGIQSGCGYLHFRQELWQNGRRKARLPPDPELQARSSTGKQAAPLQFDAARPPATCSYSLPPDRQISQRAPGSIMPYWSMAATGFADDALAQLAKFGCCQGAFCSSRRQVGIVEHVSPFRAGPVLDWAGIVVRVCARNPNHSPNLPKGLTATNYGELSTMCP